ELDARGVAARHFARVRRHRRSTPRTVTLRLLCSTSMRWRIAMALYFAVGCGPETPNGDGSASGGESSTSASTSGATNSSTSTTVTSSSNDDAITSADSSTSTGDDTSSSSGSFIAAPDALCSVSQCDVWAQDCPRGNKCVPFSSAGDGTFGGC